MGNFTHVHLNSAALTDHLGVRDRGKGPAAGRRSLTRLPVKHVRTRDLRARVQILQLVLIFLVFVFLIYASYKDALVLYRISI